MDPPEIIFIPNLSYLNKPGVSDGKTGLVLTVGDLAIFKQDYLNSGLAVNLAKEGLALFVLIGSNSEEAHDALDYELEQNNLLGVITTWHDDDTPDEIVTCFNATAISNGLAQIFVVQDRSTKFTENLVSEIRTSCIRSGLKSETWG